MGLAGFLKEKQHLRVRRGVLRGIVMVRIRDEMNTGLTFNEIKRVVKSWDDATLFGTPEGTLVSILYIYWRMKIRQHMDDESIFNHIDHLRELSGFPRGDRPNGLSLEDYVIYRIRLEEPELYSPESISDSYLRKEVNAVNEFSTNFAW